MNTEVLAVIEQRLHSIFEEIYGTDTSGGDYPEVQDLWNYMFNKSPKKRKKGKGSATTQTSNSKNNNNGNGWYEKAFEYWENPENCPVSDDGVLGGFGHLTPLDVRDSNLFLDSLQSKYPFIQYQDIADCGAGIGRVTKNLLLPRCTSSVTLIEQSPRLLQSAAQYIGDSAGKRVAYVQQGLQEFIPEENSYDLIWIQWVIGHLNDIDFIEFFQRCIRGLKPTGLIILKDNVIVDAKTTYCIDLDDNSVTRNLSYSKILFELANLKIIAEIQQANFPEELYPVFMIALVGNDNPRFS